MNVRTPGQVVAPLRRPARKEGAGVWRAVALLVILVGALVIPASASARTNTLQFRGLGAEVDLTAVDPNNNCLERYVILNAGESRVQDGGKPTTTTYARILVYLYDICAGGPPFLELIGTASLPAGSFQADTRQNSASLIASFEMCDVDFPEICSQVDANLTWTGVGDVQRNKSISHTTGDACKSIVRTTGESRSAQAAGTLTVFGATGTAGATDFALLYYVTLGSVEVDCS